MTINVTVLDFIATPSSRRKTVGSRERERERAVEISQQRAANTRNVVVKKQFFGAPISSSLQWQHQRHKRNSIFSSDILSILFHIKASLNTSETLKLFLDFKAMHVKDYLVQCCYSNSRAHIVSGNEMLMNSRTGKQTGIWRGAYQI